MTPQSTVLSFVLCVGILLTRISVSIAAPGVVPKLDMNPTCKAAEEGAVFIGRTKETCMTGENAAHEVLTRHWSQFHKVDKTTCVGKVNVGGPPSYVELLSCLEMMKHLRTIRESRLKIHVKKTAPLSK